MFVSFWRFSFIFPLSMKIVVNLVKYIHYIDTLYALMCRFFPPIRILPLLIRHNGVCVYVCANSKNNQRKDRKLVLIVTHMRCMWSEWTVLKREYMIINRQSKQTNGKLKESFHFRYMHKIVCCCRFHRKQISIFVIDFFFFIKCWNVIA